MNREDRKVTEAYIQAVLSEREKWLYQSALNKVRVITRSMKPAETGIFLRRYYYLQNTAEIAEAFGIRENHVRSILSKTRKKIKKTIKEKEGERK